MFVIDTARFQTDAATRLGIRLTPERQQAMDFLLTRLGADPAFTMIRQLAYVLATIQWETASTFQPIRERRASRERNPRHWEIQNRYWPSGFYGRGYIQITWRENYLNAGRKLAGLAFDVEGERVTITSETFVQNPDLVMHPEISYLICARGMREGWFTGRKLADYVREGTPPDYVNARRIVNGVDKANEIAAIANTYELLLRATSTPVGEVMTPITGIRIPEPVS